MLHFTRIAAAVLVLLGLLLGVLAWRLARAPERAPSAADRALPAEAVGRPVVVAARPLRAGVPVEADDLRIERLTIATAAALQDPAALVGRIPVADLPEGLPLATALFATGLAQRLEPGERAVAVHVDETIGVGHQVRPGDFVDVYLVLRRDGEIDQSQARLLMARNRVLAYGGASVDGPPGATGAPGVRQEAARTVVLAVPADLVGRLALSESSGRLFLALRNPREDDGAAGSPAAASAPRRAGLLPAGQTLRELAGLPAAPSAPAASVALAGALPVVSARPLPSNRPAARSPGAAGEGTGRRIEILRGSVQETLSY